MTMILNEVTSVFTFTPTASSNYVNHSARTTCVFSIELVDNTQ